MANWQIFVSGIGTGLLLATGIIYLIIRLERRVSNRGLF